LQSITIQTTITTSLMYISLNGPAYDNGWGKAEHPTLPDSWSAYL